MSERNVIQGSVNPQDQVHQPMNPMGHPTSTTYQESSLSQPTSFGSSSQQGSFNAFGQSSVHQPSLVSQVPPIQPPILSTNTNQQVLTTTGETIPLSKTCCKGTCNPIEDAERIRKALKGIANDEHPLIEILGRRPNTHMQRVREEYEKLYHTDLLSKVKSEIKSVYKCLAVSLIKSHPEYKADLIYKSLKENKHYESEPFVNWIVADDPRSLEETKHHFRTRYSMSLTDFVKSCTKGRFKRLLLRSLEGRRSTQIQPELIETDVQMLCGEGRRSWGSEEILDLFTLRSREHLVLVSQRFEQRFNVSLERTIINETKSFFQSGILACLEPPSIYWSKRLYQGFKDLEVSDCLLVCCFSQLSKPFLQQVAVQYHKIFNISLQDEIKKHTSGYYCELLLTLIDCPETEKTQYDYVLFDHPSKDIQTEKKF